MAHTSRPLAAVIDWLAWNPRANSGASPLIDSVEGFFMELNLGNDPNVCFYMW